MGNNAIIFGAGASYSAGVPMLDTFIEKLRGYALRKLDDSKNPLSENDIKIFEKAMKVMYALNEYHARAAFNDRNLEDLLSILSFSILGQDNSDRTNLESMVDAIVRTIELSCKVKHDGRLNVAQTEGSSLYRQFWDSLFMEWSKSRNNPVIISLNYDLVLERSLFQMLITRDRVPSKFPFDGVILDYKYEYLTSYSYKLIEAVYYTDPPSRGTGLKECNQNELKRPIVIEILKLHGSLNFPSTSIPKSSGVPTTVVEKPLLVPPVSNKLINNEMTNVWNSALKHLREVKNLIIVGYSLPRSDVYMQFFLKTALGPNKDFDKLIIFNPTLFEGSAEATEMEQRYSSCFSEQLRKYIYYRPREISGRSNLRLGTFEHFVEALSVDDHGLFF
jgi:hypothetical protein